MIALPELCASCQTAAKEFKGLSISFKIAGRQVDLTHTWVCGLDVSEPPESPDLFHGELLEIINASPKIANSVFFHLAQLEGIA
jgi:hypothetical protein